MRPAASPGLRSRLAGPLAQAAVSALLVFALLAAFLLFSYRSTEATITTAPRNEVRVARPNSVARCAGSR